MTVISVDKDHEACTMTIHAEFDAAPERVWQLWADPRQLERWWGPPQFPATVVEHDLRPGGTMTYFMTGPDGARYHGWWRVVSAEPPRALEIDDGFGDDQGNPNPEMPVTRMAVAIDERDGGGTRMHMRSTFASVEAMEQLLTMGMEEGITLALGQADALLVPA